MLKIAKGIAAATFFASVLVGCNQDATGLTTVPASTNSSAAAGSTTAESATLSWQAPTTNADGTPLTDLAGYKIYYGPDASDLTKTVQLNTIGVQTYVISDLTSGTWYFAIKAVSGEGVESALSDIVSKTL